ncbi:Fatty acyl-CoA reductase 2 [Eumeta japonica]|uniref:Fatty acyl-CoA reductase n=1 Tax=Eumeta variegata TaxID=151549 RepID=A0A4C1XE60_EUMVA|nr:Fatty acyl-CoA reductase 2 [Eumeta japonica]
MSKKKAQHEVDVIFHGAATVRFDDHIKKAVLTNVRGTREVLLLAAECKHLSAFVHVSTAYSNAPRSECKEEFYPSPIASDLMIEMAETVDEDILERITPGLIGDWPNTYTFSKALAEDQLKRLAVEYNVPAVVIRPAIATHDVYEKLVLKRRIRLHVQITFGLTARVDHTLCILYRLPQRRQHAAPTNTRKSDGVPVGIFRQCGLCDATAPMAAVFDESATTWLRHTASQQLAGSTSAMYTVRAEHWTGCATFYTYIQDVVDLVPVDMVNNLAIAAAYDVAENGIQTPKIYNYSSTQKNVLKWSKLISYSIYALDKICYESSTNSSKWDSLKRISIHLNYNLDKKNRMLTFIDTSIDMTKA